MAQGLRHAFLEKAADSMITDSPSTSAFFMAEIFDALAASSLTISPALKATCCSACGYLFVPGWTATQVRETRSNSAIKRIRGAQRQLVRKNVMRHCWRCYRKSVVAMEKPGKFRKRKEVSSKLKDKPVTANPLSEGPSSAKSTAKQRAKERKSSQGLQALMSSRRKQKTAASIPTFDLMDFMKA